VYGKFTQTSGSEMTSFAEFVQIIRDNSSGKWAWAARMRGLVVRSEFQWNGGQCPPGAIAVTQTCSRKEKEKSKAILGKQFWWRILRKKRIRSLCCRACGQHAFQRCSAALPPYQ
jgi:hypothetical protein